ncbi:MAG: glycolate oxidase subunit GlcE [Anderseniella sp.]|uniref:glycolate oxidase subunit GlcE n=1 Tax=Parasphingorhabdus sp. TaxID=2709688 RepID=UPI0032963B74
MKPKSEQELADAVKASAAKGTRLQIRGGGSRVGLGHGVTGELLDTTGLKGVSLYEPGALTIVAAAGTPLETIEKTLAKEGQRLPFEPMDHRALYGTNGKSTIGGVVAANISGPRRIQAGACRDSLIGVRFVDGDGTIIKNGGRVMKNVTGYDLVKLMAGSHGTLGVLTEVAFKVLPMPEAGATVVVEGLDNEKAGAAMSTALTAPYDVNGAAHLPASADQSARTCIRVEGFDGSVKYRSGQLKELLGSFGDVSIEAEQARCAKLWQQIRDAEAVAAGEGDIWRVSVKPSDGAKLAVLLGDKAQLQFDWGGGLVWVCVPEGTDVRASMNGIDGHATLIRSSEPTAKQLGVFQPEPAPLAKISAGLRSRFDPHGILNPGRMG